MQPTQATRDADLRDRSAASEHPDLRERLGEVLPLVFFVPLAGPPAVLLVGPLLLLTLLLIPPAALLITFVVAFLVAAGFLAALGALIASPYLLVRHLRARHAAGRMAPAVSEVAGVRSERPVTQPVRTRLIHLTTR